MASFKKGDRDNNFFISSGRIISLSTVLIRISILKESPGTPTNLNKSVSVDIGNLMELVQEVMTERSKVDVRIDGPDKEKSQALLDILRVGTSSRRSSTKSHYCHE
ncbi:MAG: hypothetical protein PF503_24915 [Desulfobacula sp.]|jgi:hypothetical protein|nr:hypothetical protein [Desulfobacula sp.]